MNKQQQEEYQHEQNQIVIERQLFKNRSVTFDFGNVQPNLVIAEDLIPAAGSKTFVIKEQA
jgi:hypothetical protein